MKKMAKLVLLVFLGFIPGCTAARATMPAATGAQAEEPASATHSVTVIPHSILNILVNYDDKMDRIPGYGWNQVGRRWNQVGDRKGKQEVEVILYCFGLPTDSPGIIAMFEAGGLEPAIPEELRDLKKVTDNIQKFPSSVVALGAYWQNTGTPPLYIVKGKLHMYQTFHYLALIGEAGKRVIGPTLSNNLWESSTCFAARPKQHPAPPAHK